MCTGAEAGLIISALGTGASAVNQNNTLKRQDREAAAGILRNSKNQSQANKLVNDQIQDIKASDGSDERTQALSDFQGALRDAKTNTEGSLQPVVGANERFAERVGTGASRIAKSGDESAQRMAVIDGILRQRMHEGQRVGRTGSDIEAVRGNVNAEDFLTRLRVGSQNNNPWVDAGGSFLEGLGGAMSQKLPKPPPGRYGT